MASVETERLKPRQSTLFCRLSCFSGALEQRLSNFQPIKMQITSRQQDWSKVWKTSALQSSGEFPQKSVNGLGLRNCGNIIFQILSVVNTEKPKFNKKYPIFFWCEMQNLSKYCCNGIVNNKAEKLSAIIKFFKQPACGHGFFLNFTLFLGSSCGKCLFSATACKIFLDPSSTHRGIQYTHFGFL